MHEPAAVTRLARQPMSREAARRLCERVKRGFEDARAALLELYDRQGWHALGYASWRECAVEEFSLSQGRVYQLLSAARVEREIDTRVESQVDERTLRQLAPLETAAEKQAVWDEALQEYGGPPPSRGLAELVARATAALTPERVALLVEAGEAALAGEVAAIEGREADDDLRARLDRGLRRIGQAMLAYRKAGRPDVVAALAEARRLAGLPSPAEAG